MNLIALLFSFFFLLLSAETVSVASQPNIILVLTDDQGWGDTGYSGNENLETPHIDSLARDGLAHERFYVSPVCAPTRASILTGRDALRTGVFYVTRNGEALPSSEVTIAEYLKEHGYRTGLFGKWHNGAHYPEHPNGQGFDEFIGFTSGHTTSYFDTVLEKNGQPYQTKGYLPDVLTQEAINFIVEGEVPFFTMIAFNTPHSPFELPEEYFNKYKKRGLSDLNASVYGMVENIDDNFGKILATLDERGIREDTIILFLSDNGPAFPGGETRFNGGLAGHKGQVNEGGVRVPFFLSWPGTIPSGLVAKDISQHTDLFPTLVSLAGLPVPNELDLDGRDLSGVWLAEQEVPDRYIFTSRMRNTKEGWDVGVQDAPAAVRSQSWTAIKSPEGKWSLFDPVGDPSERLDLSLENPEQLAEMTAAYKEWFADAVKEGSPEYRPIPVGSGFVEQDILPAHEAHLVGAHMRYAHDWGWSHDWIVSWDRADEYAIWPVKVLQGGFYRVSLEYASPSDGAKASVRVFIDGKNIQSGLLPDHALVPVSGSRLFHTGEAPDVIWGSTNVGTVYLGAGEYEIRVQPDNGTFAPNLKALRLGLVV